MITYDHLSRVHTGSVCVHFSRCFSLTVSLCPVCARWPCWCWAIQCSGSSALSRWIRCKVSVSKQLQQPLRCRGYATAAAACACLVLLCGCCLMMLSRVLVSIVSCCCASASFQASFGPVRSLHLLSRAMLAQAVANRQVGFRRRRKVAPNAASAHTIVLLTVLCYCCVITVLCS